MKRETLKVKREKHQSQIVKRIVVSREVFRVTRFTLHDSRFTRSWIR